MNIKEFAIWRRLDLPGHDAAQLSSTTYGHLLQGIAVFRSAEGPACLNYTVEVDHDWQARHGRVHGFVADRKIDHLIGREADGWYLDGVSIAGLGHLVDLDYGFTPRQIYCSWSGQHPTTGSHSTFRQHGLT